MQHLLIQASACLASQRSLFDRVLEYESLVIGSNSGVMGSDVYDDVAFHAQVEESGRQVALVQQANPLGVQV
jgi:hypothetical protein